MCKRCKVLKTFEQRLLLSCLEYLLKGMEYTDVVENKQEILQQLAAEVQILKTLITINPAEVF